MAKKNSTAKDTEPSLSLFGKVAALFKSETVHFVIGLVLVIFSVYLLLAFSSFFFTGAADQSILDGDNAQELISTNNGVKNYAGSRGAQLASYLINDCFGISSYLILVFLAVAGLKLMRVRVVRLWKWFIGCSLMLVYMFVAVRSTSSNNHLILFLNTQVFGRKLAYFFMQSFACVYFTFWCNRLHAKKSGLGFVSLLIPYILVKFANRIKFN